MEQKTLNTLEYPRILAALAAHCHFNPAREMALELKPSADLEEVQELQNETADAVALLTIQPGTTIGGARDLRPIVEDALRGIVLEPTRLLQVKDSLVAARSLKRLFQKFQGDYPTLESISEQLPDSLGLVSLITKVISDKDEVLDSASEKLGHIRRELKTQYTRLKNRMNQMLKSLRWLNIFRNRSSLSAMAVMSCRLKRMPGPVCQALCMTNPPPGQRFMLNPRQWWRPIINSVNWN